MALNHIVRTYDINGKVLYEDCFHTADRAYEEFTSIIKLLNRKLEKDEAVVVTRYNDGYLMNMEVIEK